MSIIQHRELSCGSLGSLGCRSVGCPGPALWLPHSFLHCSFPLPCPSSPSKLFPFLHQGRSFGRCGCRPAGEGCGRACFLFSRLLQSSLCHFQGHQGWCPVIDLSRLNRSVDVSHFHMETSQSALQSLHL